MDPTENVKEQLRLARKMLRAIDGSHEVPDVRDTARLAELVVALNDWLRKGGFLPEGWAR